LNTPRYGWKSNSELYYIMLYRVQLDTGGDRTQNFITNRVHRDTRGNRTQYLITQCCIT
jgi:hypothetical protein